MIDPIERQDAIDVANNTIPSDWFDILYPKLEALSSAQQEQQHGRIFQEIVVEYPLNSPYLEYIGKPYFSIKYTENGQEFIGYGTYKLEVLSEYLKEYFIPSIQPTLYGYNIEHLELIARILQKENLPPERVAEALTDISRIVAIVTDEFKETLRKAVKQCMI